MNLFWSLNEVEATTEVALIGALAALLAVVLFSFGRRGAGGFRVFPSSPQEWLAFWFHNLEFVLCCCLLVGTNRAFFRMPSKTADVIVYAVLCVPVLLILSAIIFWRCDRRLCRAAIVWAVAGVGFLLLPAVPVTKQSVASVAAPR